MNKKLAILIGMVCSGLCVVYLNGSSTLAQSSGSCVMGARAAAERAALGYACVQPESMSSQGLCNSYASGNTDPTLTVYTITGQSCKDLGFESGSARTIGPGEFYYCLVNPRLNYTLCSAETVVKMKTIIGF